MVSFIGGIKEAKQITTVKGRNNKDENRCRKYRHLMIGNKLMVVGGGGINRGPA